MLRQTKYKITIYALAGLILLTLLGFWLYWASAQARDYRRLADLKVWQNILSDYYAQNGTYRVPDCGAGETLSRCLKAAAGRWAINNIDDPINISPYRYAVANLSDDDYEISFSLEAGIGGLAPGQYLWTKGGVKR